MALESEVPSHSMRHRWKNWEPLHSSLTYVVALDISKAFNNVWHKSLISKFPSLGFNLFLMNSFPVFFPVVLLERPLLSISTMVFHKVLFYALPSSLSLSDFSTNYHNHSYAVDSDLHSSTSSRYQSSSPTRSTSRITSTTALISYLNNISRWGRHNQFKFIASKTQFLRIPISIIPLYSISFKGFVV